MQTCKNCDRYDRRTQQCGFWQWKAQKPEQDCGNYAPKSAVIAVKTVKEHKFITY